MSTSAGADSLDEMAIQSHYSLRWNNHQAHILHAFEGLLQAELLVDCTLVCAETSLRAHKIVLSICSPFFERIFAEHPCKHPVIVLKDFSGREIAALIDFMYRGEVRVQREDLSGLMHAAESLQIRGLSLSEPRPVSPPETPTAELLSSSRCSPEPPSSIVDRRNSRPILSPPTQEQSGRCPSGPNRDGASSPSMPRRKQARPRRRSGELSHGPQDLSGRQQQQDRSSLSPPPTGLDLSSGQLQAQHHRTQSEPRCSPMSEPIKHEREEQAENLSMKESRRQRSLSPPTSTEPGLRSDSEADASSPRGSPLTGAGLPPDGPFPELGSAGTPGLPPMSGLSLTPPHQTSSSGPNGGSGTPSANEYLNSLGQFAASWLPPRHPRDDSPKPPAGFPFGAGPESAGLGPRGFPPMDRLPLFPHGPGGGAGGGGPLDLGPDGFHNLFVNAGLGPHHPHHPHHHHHHQPHHHHPSHPHHHHPTKKAKKHRGGHDGLPRRWSDHARGLGVCRPKGQHSAPRGGPPRSWTNADLTEALTMVWNKKMTTSQASRVFGIPYNSLLMYVRGKYGKSLKLEQLRKDCTGEVMNSLNNNVKPLEPPASSPGSRMGPLAPPPPPGSQGPMSGAHPEQQQPQQPEAASFAHPPLLSGGSFFPDFPGFPLPVNMVHLLPPSEQRTSSLGPHLTSSNGQRQRSSSPDQLTTERDQGLMPQQHQHSNGPSGSSRSPSPIDVSSEGPLHHLHHQQQLPMLQQHNGPN
ncbi:hypothetical protein QAD02_016084 [Eretmocerus hayati]|uniref:Uncharacterized protein n=1 Tax=Eretmocerus hayati TaxID=131215 RepID=A0ACC2PA29_9HYME|nr:hypothetical protein QAD02_016084 [Eretmocerus hayati]